MNPSPVASFGTTKLSVNLNKVALVRNSRGKNTPDLVQVALDCESFGADGITLHPRPDERHARKADIFALKPVLSTELNVEGYPSEDFLRLIEATRPAQCTFVPDPPDALTSSAGWDTIRYQAFLAEVIARMRAAGVRVSIFVAPDLDAIEGAKMAGTDRIELFTEPYADAFGEGHPEAVELYARAAGYAHELGLGVNAGHDLNLHNLEHFARLVPHLDEVSIGHALISDALYLGLKETILRYQRCLGKAV